VKLKPQLNDDEIIALAKLNEVGAGAALIKLLEEEVKKRRQDLEESPHIDCVDCKRDFRYAVGFIAGLKFVTQSQRIAREMISNEPKEWE
jgi:hypothetical protein